MEINISRMVLLIFLIGVIYFFRVNEFWRKAYSPKSLAQNIVIMLIIDIGILTVFYFNQGCSNQQNDMYNENLVKALSKGEVFISDTPDNTKLEELENPYDSIERANLERDTDYMWDAAYYNGKYYVYFGVVPAILVMLPYYIITKKLLNSATVVLLFSLLSIPVLAILTKKIFQKYFKEFPFRYMALSMLIMIFGTMLIVINVAPRFYELVTVAGFFFAILGFLLVFDSEKENGKVSFVKLFFGALSLALAVGCRPTHVFSSILILPFLYRMIKNQNHGKLFGKKLILFLCVVGIPYLVVAIFIMRYNYLRFGSVFEFGEKYQLTVNNMKELSIRGGLLPTGLLCNLFGLPTFEANFPFIHMNGNLIDTFGYYYVEDMIGGVFMITPIALFCFGIVKCLKNCEDKSFKEFCTCLLVTGLIFVIFISLKAGSTGRYLLDFAWIFTLCGLMVFMKIMEKLKTEEAKDIFGKIFQIITCYIVVFHVLSGFCAVGGENSMRNNSPKQYFDADYTVMFFK